MKTTEKKIKLDFSFTSKSSIDLFDLFDDDCEDLTDSERKLIKMHISKPNHGSRTTTKVKNKSKSVVLSKNSIYSDIDDNYDEKYINSKKVLEKHKLILEDDNNSKIKYKCIVVDESVIGFTIDWQYPLTKKHNNYDEVDSKERIITKASQKIERDLKEVIKIFDLKDKKEIKMHFPSFGFFKMAKS